MPLTRLKSPAAAGRWLKSWVTGTLRTDSREVRAGDGFIAWPGSANDGRRFVGDALAAGAATCLVEEAGAAEFAFEDARVATLTSLKAATGQIAAAFFDEPTQALAVIATTGTNGKTSTAWWTAQALNLLGRRTGFVGTLGVGVPPRPSMPTEDAMAHDPGIDWAIRPTGLTTPDPVLLQAAFRRMVDAGFGACAIEASSIGIVEHRLAGTRIEVALFTNFTRDHLDYHGTMDAYWAAKRLLFGWVGLKAAVVNVDDDAGALLASELRQGTLDVWTYTTTAERSARLAAEDVRYVDGGLAFAVVERAATTGDEAAEEGAPRAGAGHDAATSASVHTRLIGDYNVSNLLAVLGGLRALGVPLAQAAQVAGRVTPVPGRMQRVDRLRGVARAGTGSGELIDRAHATGSGNGNAEVQAPEVVVDYAHTPDALEKVLPALRSLARARGGRLVCVFGCGGDRDATKRPLMGAIAARLADAVIVTSDNPRSEDPQAIVDQVAAGAGDRAAVRRIVDRRDAIATAVRDAASVDVVLLAGKGHEDYQEIAGRRLPFSDVEEARAALAAREAGA
ncbi:MAG TPA: UDP-N-acetylmuramoyl-L-alanyl-D-glutamate--2,6-diaminopimelate ligase [Burkholderiaceae bacterium]|jgi:UDP-N-acetylmuramoyl-L-alanyl-D-glutamate--2,6-diaminopimelate ligase|nr:UDP-N-acetylmuramoyl-L-alanyl-D-glutamate--2,6-diaminopimelate ligase [Burkholderiaceae bacterium]